MTGRRRREADQGSDIGLLRAAPLVTRGQELQTNTERLHQGCLSGIEVALMLTLWPCLENETLATRQAIDP